MSKQNNFISNYNLTSVQKAQFQDIRSRIDSVDDQLIDLLTKRTEIIKEAKIFKSSFYPEDKCYITPGREASMVKAIISKAQNVGLPPQAIMNIWRNIISSSTSVEKELSINAYLKKAEYAQLLDANDYFGNFAKITTYDNTFELLKSTAASPNSVAVVPYDSEWWLQIFNNFVQLKVFGCLPFITSSAEQNPRTVIIANILPEPTNDDITLFVLQTLKNDLTATEEVDDKFASNIVQTITNDGYKFYLVQQSGYYQNYDDICSKDSCNIIGSLNIGTFALPIIL
jgi:chorismate mutase